MNTTRRCGFTCRATAAALALLPTAGAQAIVGMESLHLGSPEPGFRGELELAWSGASGSTDKTDFAVATRLEHHRERHTDFLVASHAYGQVSDVDNTKRSFLHLRHIYQHTPALAWEGFGQGQSDEFARLAFRGLLGGGARFTLIEKTDVEAAFLGIGAMYSRERYTALAGIEPTYSQRLWRGNLYLVFKYELRPGVRMANTLYYQPALEDFGDYRLQDAFALQIDITDTLALQLSANVAHNSRPPTSVDENDVVYRTGINWSF